MVIYVIKIHNRARGPTSSIIYTQNHVHTSILHNTYMYRGIYQQFSEVFIYIAVDLVPVALTICIERVTFVFERYHSATALLAYRLFTKHRVSGLQSGLVLRVYS